MDFENPATGGLTVTRARHPGRFPAGRRSAFTRPAFTLVELSVTLFIIAVLMALLFVGGVMNLVWVAILAMLVLAEKLAPAGLWVSRVAGAALIAWGVARLVI